MNLLSEKLIAAVKLHKAGDLDRAETLYRDVVRVDPSHADALHLLGVAAHQRQQHEQAVDYIRRAIALNDAMPIFYSNLGAAYRALGRLDDAVESFQRSLRLDPSSAGAHYNFAMALEGRERFDEAIREYREALRLNPRFAEAHNNLGKLHASRGETERAAACFREAIRLQPDFAAAHFNRGNAQYAQRQLEDAVASYRQSIKLAPGVAGVHNNLGMALKDLERLVGARRCLEEALRLQPDYAEAASNLGSVLLQQGDPAAAIESFQRAAELAPNRADIHYNLATAWQQQKQISRAIQVFQRVLEIDPDLPGAHCNLAMIYESAGYLSLAADHYRQALARKPSPHRRLQMMTMLMPVYQSVEEMVSARRGLSDNIDSLLAEGFTVDPSQNASSTCFYLAYHGCDDRPLLEKFHRLFRCPELPAANGSVRTRAPGRRIRIGFASRYFRNHTVGRLMRGLIKRLSIEDFHVTVFSNEPHRDEIASEIRNAADDYVILTGNVPRAIERVRERGLDVLFYADLGMDPLTYSLAHFRLAPVQCVTWGHPVTTGMKTVDYFLSSRLAEAEDAQAHYTERLIELQTFPTYYYRPPAIERTKGRTEFGLPEEGSLYLCPQSLFKIHPEFDAVLRAILQCDPRGYVVLISGIYRNWTDLLRKRLARTLADLHDRVLIIPRQDYQDFHNLLELADVLLDPLHFGGGNTNYEAMAFGIPVVTLPSRFLRGRVAWALYRKMNVMDCVAESLSHYVDLAVRLARDRSFRESVSGRILDSCSVLYEDDQAVKEIEAFLKQAVQSARRSP